MGAESALFYAYIAVFVVDVFFVLVCLRQLSQLSTDGGPAIKLIILVLLVAARLSVLPADYECALYSYTLSPNSIINFHASTASGPVGGLLERISHSIRPS